jgi:hypothetical protein
MEGARTVGVSRAALRSAALMRRCQPGPRARKWAITSRSRRKEISCLVGACCGPRPRRYASTTSGATSVAGRMRAHISSVSCNASGSCAMPARISTSSASVVVASWRSAFRRASRQALSDVFGISPHIALLRSPQTDDSDLCLTARENEHMEPVADEGNRNLTQFSIVLTVIDVDIRGVPVQAANCSEVDLVGTDVGGALCFVPLVLGRRIHNFDDSRRLFCSQADCIYNLLLGMGQ